MAQKNDFTLKVDDYSLKVLMECGDLVQKGLAAIGAEAEGYAKKSCPVDTGRLRNSITFATASFHSEGNTNKSPKGEQDADPEEYATHAKPEADAVYLGTNVEYASLIEYQDMKHKTGKAHFIKDAMTNHMDHYKAIMKAALQGKS